MAKSNYLGLPENVKFCKSCVISNQDLMNVEFKNTENEQKPTIDFNENGLCSACEYQNLKAKK